MPTSTLSTAFTEATSFPSHRSYLYNIPDVGEPTFVEIMNYLSQGVFSNLWFLPPIPAP